MTTQPIARWRPRSIESQPAPRIATIVVLVAISAVIFVVAFAAGRSHGVTPAAQRGVLPASLPVLASPVPESLAAVPPIEVGVNGGQPASHAKATPRQAASPPVASAPQPAEQTAPAVSAPATPTAASPPAAPAPSPAPSRPSSPSGGGAGTSFESSG